MRRFILTLTMGLLLMMNAFAQQAIRDQLFGEIEKQIEKAQTENVNVLSPSTFDKAYEKYQDAVKNFEKGGNLEKIRKQVQEADQYLKKAFEFADLARLSFSSAISSRSDALEAKADVFATEFWKKAEEKFRDAMEEMEDNDLKNAKKKAGEAESYYRKAELAAIENNLLNPARELLKKADDMDAEDYAPITFKKAKLYMDSTVSELRANRYDREKARLYAEMAKYEASHAIYLTNLIKKLKKQDNAFEQVILMSEMPLQKLANTLDVEVAFDNGLGDPANSIQSALDQLMKEKEQCEQDLSARDEKIVALNEQIEMMQKRLGKFTEEEEALRKKIALKEEQESKIKQIAQTITEKEGKVLLDGDHVILRLYGLSFPSGKSEIKPENFALLRKVQDAIRLFKNPTVVVEGHTDSRGSSEINMRLSQERANAVMQYLIANMGIDSSKIQAKGYGETKPVASNKTEEGRAKNRRIDIVIIPEWASK